MNTKLVGLDWNTELTLFPGSRSTSAPDSVMPWCCLSEIIPGLFLTCEQQLANRMVAMDEGIALIVNLCAEDHVAPFKVYEYPASDTLPRYRRIDTIEEFVNELDGYTQKVAPLAKRNRKVFIRNIAAVDAANYEIDRHFPETCTLLELVMVNRSKLLNSEKDSSRLPSVGVHCMVGVSRSASVVLAYLMKATGVTRDEALSFVQSTRWVVNPNPGFQQQLLLWEATDSKRIFDEFSAEVVANELQKKRSVVEYVQKQLPVILKQNKCTGEREYFGYVLAKGLATPETEKQVAMVYRELRSYITAAIDSEVYADTPNFFGYVAEIVNSIQRFVPAVLFTASTESSESGFVWSDTFYYRVVKDIGRSGFVKDTCDTVRAFCSLLEAVHVKQLARTPLCLLSRVPGKGSNISTPSSFALSFPFLPFMAPYAEGFVEFSDLNLLETQFPTEGASMDSGELDAVATKVAEVFLSAFLVSTTGVSSPVNPNGDGGNPTQATEDLDSTRRWCPTSRLLFLRPDVEVAVFESLSKNKKAVDVQIRELVALCTGCSNELVALATVRKVAAGVLAYRLILEAVDRFVYDAYRERLQEGTVVTHAETRLPLSRVTSLLNSVTSVFTRQFRKPCDLQQYFRVELEPLVRSEVVHSDGVWSKLTKA